MKTCTINITNEVDCVIGGLYPDHYEKLHDVFGFFVDGHRHMPSFQLRRWDGKIRYFEKTGKTYTKLLDEIVPWLVSWGYEIDINDSRPPVKVPTAVLTEETFSEYGIKMRPYQVEAVKTLVREGSGFAKLATGAGKTLLCAGMCWVFNQADMNVLIIVPSSDLVSQTAAELRVVGIDVGEYSGDTKVLGTMATVATWQSLQYNQHIVSMYDCVIIDEAHGAKAEVIKELVNVHGKNISYRYGVTGTMPKPKTDLYTLKCSIGQVHIEVTSRWLIDNGYLSDIDIDMIETQDVADLPDYGAEKAFTSKNQDRLERIAELVMDYRNKYGNTMVLVNSIQFGRKLQKAIPDSVFLSGESEKDLRKENYDKYQDMDGIITIATSGIASTGISINRIFCLMMIDAGKSFIKAIQSVGRGLRKAGDKKRVKVVDVYSKLKFSKKHSNERKKHYKEAEYEITGTTKLTYDTNKGVSMNQFLE